MNLYELLCPVWTNDREKAYAPERLKLEQFIVDLCGGITRLGIAPGSWRNDAGKVVDDANYVLRFALEADHAEAHTRNLIVGKALELFADQDAIFIAKVGTAKIVNRNAESMPPDSPSTSIAHGLSDRP